MVVTMFRAIRFLVFFVLLVFVACEVKRPENVLSPERMEAFLYDYHLVQSMSGEFSASTNKEKLFYDYVFRKHGITKEQFDTSMVWYNRFPKHIQRIYARLEERLDKEVLSLDNARGTLDEGVSIEVAYLASDTAELWTSSKVRLLSPTPFCNRVMFSFETPDDTTFLPGDSIQFSFHARFISAGADSVGQRLRADVVLDYADGSYAGAGLDVTGNGKYMLSVVRNMASKLKSMSGFVYYADDDSTLASKAIVSGLSLRRFRVNEPGKTLKKD